MKCNVRMYLILGCLLGSSANNVLELCERLTLFKRNDLDALKNMQDTNSY